MDPDFDDSGWLKKIHGEFPPYEGSRFYRFSTAVNTTAFVYSGSALFSLCARNVSSLYVNGKTVFANMSTSLLILMIRDTRVSNRYGEENDQSAGIFQYSIPVQQLNNTIVIAVQSDSEILFPIKDEFDLLLLLVPEASSRLGDSLITSAHHRDYYSNPLEDVFDNSRVTYWKSIGRSTDFVVTFNNGRSRSLSRFICRYEYLNSYSITSAVWSDSNPVSWKVSGCVREGDDWLCDVLDERSDALWKGTIHTLSFPMNARQVSYQRYEIDFGNSRNWPFICSWIVD